MPRLEEENRRNEILMNFDPVTSRSLLSQVYFDNQRFTQPADGRYTGFNADNVSNYRNYTQQVVNNDQIANTKAYQDNQNRILGNLRDANAANLKGSLANKNAPSLLERLNALDNPTAAKPAQQVSNNPLAKLVSALQPSQESQQNPLFASLNRPDQGASATGPNSLLKGEDFASRNLSLNPQVLQQRQQYVNSAALLTTLTNQGVDPKLAQASLAAQLGAQMAGNGIARAGALGPMAQAMKTQASNETNSDKTGAGASRDGYSRKRLTDKMNAMLAKHQGSGLGQQGGQPQPQMQQGMQQLAQQIRQRQQAPALTA